ncbi:sulfatase family protein [Haloimpatiens massiliensis]|uniref:sulfatase family protein n=1 Tax=Haloimpatiens massiliensis TaxID=1658110 RepID=UPI000C836D02|nr:sulfatase [Haloimpatiens massiliensis]
MNILYIHTHDSGRILSPYGYDVPTPNIKMFASDATVFTQSYCASPTCSPSRAALLTSTYPHQNGMLGLAQRGFSIDYSKHLVNFLNSEGFHTVLCGIQHEAGWYLEHEKGASIIGYKENLTCDNSKYRQEDLTIWDGKNADNLDQWINNYDKKKPFFISYGMYSTHRRYPDVIDEEINENMVQPPYPLPNNAKTRKDHARYMTSANNTDKCFGKIIESLKRNGLYEDTIIIFTTDHGLANPFSKCTLFDSGIAVSLIIRVPNSKAKGEVVDNLVSHIDVFPTLCDLLALDKPNYLEGISFAKSFEDTKAKTRNEIFAEVTFHTSYEPIRCIRTERYKYIRYYDTKYLKINKSNIDESLSKDYFLNNDLDGQIKFEEALFDLYYDVGERNNLINNPKYEGIKEKLRKKLEKHLKDTEDIILKGEIPINKKWKVNKKECNLASSKDENDYVSLGR